MSVIAGHQVGLLHDQTNDHGVLGERDVLAGVVPGQTMTKTRTWSVLDSTHMGPDSCWLHVHAARTVIHTYMHLGLTATGVPTCMFQIVMLPRPSSIWYCYHCMPTAAWVGQQHVPY